MRAVVVGLGNQGRKRAAVAGQDIVATVDPVVSTAQYHAIEQVSLDAFDVALVCTPDQSKVDTLTYLISHGKHVLVEKPLIASTNECLYKLGELVRSAGVACYTAYNHRFEPHIVRLKELLQRHDLGNIYLARLFYGNGTALDIKHSPWRDAGLGVLADLGSHLLDLTLYLFGPMRERFTIWSASCFETRAFDHVLFGCAGQPGFELEATFLSWKNTFSIDVIGELGSAHVNGLCKWGPSTFTVRRRVFPSGIPHEEVQTITDADPTWALEYEHFKRLCATGGTNIANDLWINTILHDVAATLSEKQFS